MKRRDFFNAFFGGWAGSNFIFSAEKIRLYPSFLKSKKHLETEVLVKILGTAQDGGIPQIGCYCKNCLRARKNSQFSRLISSLSIFDLSENKFFLVDATPDIRAQSDIAHQRLQLKKEGVKNAPDGVLLTHAHIGHYTGLMFFGYEAMSTHNLIVFCSARMKSFLSDNGPWSQLVSLENISFRLLSVDKAFFLTPRISITSFKVPHRHEYSDTLGFTISGKKRSLLYIPDIQNWDVWSRSIEEEAGKVNIALLDGTFYGPEELPGRDLSRIGHPFIQKSLKVLDSVVSKEKTRVYFTHLNHSNQALDPEGDASKSVEEKGFHLASEGMEFYL